MLTLYDDAFIKIGAFLSDADKIALTSTCVFMDKLKYKFIYHELVNTKNIIDLSYFDNFERVEISKKISLCPKFAKYIYFEADSTVIPSAVTHLTFDVDFNEQLDGCISSSVTHLTFGWEFNQTIKNAIPFSVTDLTFGNKFNKSIKHIPPSVVSLSFGQLFDRSFSDIPSSVTELSICTNNLADKIHIPQSIKKLTFRCFRDNVRKCVPVTVTHLTLNFCLDTIQNCLPFFKISCGITHLTIGNNFYQSLNNLIPSTVTHLKFEKYYREPLINEFIPSSVLEIKMHQDDNLLIDDRITSRVKIIRF